VPRWGEYLAAIFGGNIVYFLLEPSLPAALRHQRFQVDAGLALDFAFCVAVYGLIRLLTRRSRVAR
jgi:hypothetical protein